MSNNGTNLFGLILLIAMFGGAYASKVIQAKYVKKAIDQEKYNHGAYYRIHPVYGEKAVKTARFSLIFVDMLSWLFPLTLLIAEVYEFIAYGRLLAL